MMRHILPKIGTIPVAAITLKDLQALKEEMLTLPVSAVTSRGMLSVLRALLRWSCKQGLRGPVDFPEMPKCQYQKFVLPTPEELEKLYAAASPHIKRVTSLGSQTGVRIGECELLQLTWPDVDIDQKIIRIHGSKKNLNSP